MTTYIVTSNGACIHGYKDRSRAIAAIRSLMASKPNERFKDELHTELAIAVSLKTVYSIEEVVISDN